MEREERFLKTQARIFRKLAKRTGREILEVLLSNREQTRAAFDRGVL
ncbi:MAG: hypothetical protein HQM11_07885 [SAR324 cluster bacterium]|nr:hypothetical protein [SAR324 cluster bacterium]